MKAITTRSGVAYEGPSIPTNPSPKKEDVQFYSSKETLKSMMSLKLIAKSASDGAYNLLIFIQKHIDEFGSYDGKQTVLLVKNIKSFSLVGSCQNAKVQLVGDCSCQKDDNVIAFLMAWNVIAFLGMDVIACLHGMECDSLPSWRRIMIAFLHGMECDSLPSWHNVIAYLHDMVDKLAFMAWLLACLRGMDGKVSKIGSKARNDEIRNLKFIDTGLMKEKMKM
ncbi:hypothetical protein Tco_0992446 [Tanacetum coccineum]|uniref:Uncharacterized protein n=1 Tax=Tanacetum coccineum TaxID=301880 RepID=A0ABQ5F2D6_9ASTR